MKTCLVKNRNGSYIAEAAVVLPILILAVITTILIIMFFYENSVEKSKMHLALRCQAGQATEKTVYYIDGIQTDAGNIWDGNISVSHRGLYMIVSGDQTVSIIHKGLLRNRVDNEIYGKWDAIDSAMIRRQK